METFQLWKGPGPPPPFWSPPRRRLLAGGRHHARGGHMARERRWLVANHRQAVLGRPMGDSSLVHGRGGETVVANEYSMGLRYIRCFFFTRTCRKRNCPPPCLFSICVRPRRRSNSAIGPVPALGLHVERG